MQDEIQTKNAVLKLNLEDLDGDASEESKEKEEEKPKKDEYESKEEEKKPKKDNFPKSMTLKTWEQNLLLPPVSSTNSCPTSMSISRRRRSTSRRRRRRRSTSTSTSTSTSRRRTSTSTSTSRRRTKRSNEDKLIDEELFPLPLKNSRQIVRKVRNYLLDCGIKNVNNESESRGKSDNREAEDREGQGWSDTAGSDGFFPTLVYKYLL